METQKNNISHHSSLIKNVVDLFEKANSHASLDDALDAIPFSLLGEKPDSLPYSIWQLAEHIRIAQWDILEFSKNAKHVSPKWPNEYWPKEKAPKNEDAWNKCVNAIKQERKEFVNLIENSGNDLYKTFEHGEGQSLLKEAFVLADHNSYHTAEIIVIRRLLKEWNK